MLLIDEIKTHSALFPSGDSSRTTAAACFVDGKKCDCYALGVALCELFFSNSPNRHAYEQNGFLGLLNVVAGGDDNAENYSKILRDDILLSDVIRRPPSDGDIANWLLKTLLVRDPHERTSARRAFTMFSDMMNQYICVYWYVKTKQNLYGTFTLFVPLLLFAVTPTLSLYLYKFIITR